MGYLVAMGCLQAMVFGRSMLEMLRKRSDSTSLLYKMDGLVSERLTPLCLQCATDQTGFSDAATSLVMLVRPDKEAPRLARQLAPVS